MLEVTPLVEPLSIDEAFLDLTGTARLHGMSPALTLARLIARITEKVGITASVGLSHNKFLAKLASDLEKPRGFSVLGRAETLSFLAAKPVGFIWGVGKAMQEELAKGGITMIGQLQQMEKIDLMRRFGSMGARLYHLSRGEDAAHRLDRRSLEVDQRRDHLQHRHPGPRRTRTHPVAAGGKGLAPRQGGRRCGPHRRAEAQDRGFQAPHPQRLAGGPDAARRPHL